MLELLCRLQAISSFAKDCHYHFNEYSQHLLADVNEDDLEKQIDLINEVCYLGQGEEAPAKKDILAGALDYMVQPSNDEKENFAKLKLMIKECLVHLEQTEAKTRGANALLDNIAMTLQQLHGLLFKTVDDAKDIEYLNSLPDLMEEENYNDEDLENESDDDVEWITVKGNHIPVKKGQSKREAIDEFLEKKGKETKSTAVSARVRDLQHTRKLIHDEAYRREQGILPGAIPLLKEAYRKGMESLSKQEKLEVESEKYYKERDEREAREREQEKKEKAERDRKAQEEKNKTPEQKKADLKKEIKAFEDLVSRAKGTPAEKDVKKALERSKSELAELEKSESKKDTGSSKLESIIADYKEKKDAGLTTKQWLKTIAFKKQLEDENNFKKMVEERHKLEDWYDKLEVKIKKQKDPKEKERLQKMQDELVEEIHKYEDAM